MNENHVTINEMIPQMLSEARRLGYSEATIWRNLSPRLRTVAVYYGKKGVSLETMLYGSCAGISAILNPLDMTRWKQWRLNR